MNRDIISGAAITLALFAAGIFAPVFGSFCSFCMPLPILFYRVKSGRNAAFVIAGICFIAIAFFARGLKFDLIYAAQMFIMGLALGEAYTRNYSINRTFLTALFAVIGFGIIWIILACISQGLTPIGLLNNYIDRSLETTMLLYESKGLSQAELATLRQMFETLKPGIVKLLTGVTLLIFIVAIWANIMISRVFFKRANIPWPNFGNLQEWGTPPNLVFIAILGALFMTLFPKTSNIYFTGLTIILALFPIYCFQGLAVISFMMTRLGMPAAAHMVVYLIIIIMFLPLFGVAAIGFFDVWFNFRRLGKTPINSN